MERKNMEMARVLCVGVVGVVGVMALWGVGCERAAGPVAQASAASAKAQVFCMICGEGHKFELEADTLRAEVDGKTYYFCSEHCKTAFEKEPAKWIAKRAGKAPS